MQAAKKDDESVKEECKYFVNMDQIWIRKGFKTDVKSMP
jgi:hypothetical protein